MAIRYWRGGAGTWNATSTTNWSTTSGGAAGASAPTAADDVVFDANSGIGTITVTISSAVCRNFTHTAGANLTFTGTVSFINGSFSSTASTPTNFQNLTAIFTGATTGLTVDTNNQLFFSVTFNNASGAWSLTTPLNLTSSLTVQNGTFSTNGLTITASSLVKATGGTCTINLNASTLALSGGTPISISDAGLTLNAGTSQINCTSVAPTFAGFGKTFYNVSFTATNYTGISITGANTFNNLTLPSVSTTNVVSCAINSNQTINGTFTANSSSIVLRQVIRSSVTGTQYTITAAAVSLSNVDFRDIAGAGAASWTGTALGNIGNNSGITFPAAKSVYWNLAGTQNWTAVGWCTASGGTPLLANFPLVQDTVVIDNSSSITTLTLNGPYNLGTISLGARTSAMTLSFGAVSANIYGNWTTGTGVTISGTAAMLFTARNTTQTITSNGVAFTQGITINTVGGTVAINGNLTINNVTGTLTLTAGTLDLTNNGAGNYALTSGRFDSNSASTRAIIFGTGSITVTGNSPSLFNINTSTGLSFTGTPTVNISNNSATPATVQFGVTAVSASTVFNFNFTTGTYLLTLTTGSRFGSLDFTGFAGTWSATTASYFILGSVTLVSGMTYLGTHTWTINATSGTQVITSAGKTITTINQNNFAGLSNTVQFADATTIGTYTLANGTLALPTSAATTVTTFNTSGTTLKYLTSSTPGTQATLTKASGTTTVTYLSIKDSNVTGGTWDASAATNIDAGNNTGWTFSAPITAATGNFFLMFR